MRYSVGFFDWLFGEKMKVDLPDGQSRTVTKRWWDKMERQGMVRNVSSDVVRVHLLRPIGAMMYDAMADSPIPTYQLAYWTIGTDVSREAVEMSRDSESGDLYAMVMSKLDRTSKKLKLNTAPELCSREYWNEQAAFNGVDPK